jgi:hypothetical protein
MTGGTGRLRAPPMRYRAIAARFGTLHSQTSGECSGGHRCSFRRSIAFSGR